MFKEIICRWKAPTPAFFKKLQVLGASISGFGIGLTQVPGVTAPLVSLATHAIVAGGVVVLVAKLAIQNVVPDATITDTKTPDNVQP
jgi:hypothetical protein